MAQFEIMMRTDTPELPAEISNFSEVKAAIGEALRQYNASGIAVTAETVKDAEKVRAQLRKAKEQIETYRKDAKAAYLEKFSRLESQCKELSGLIEEPITAIDRRIKEFEDAESVKKYDEIMCIFALIPNRHEWLALNDILNPKWKNKGVTLEKLKMEIHDAVRQINADYAEIEQLYKDSPLWAAISRRFIETRDKSQTLVYAAQIEREHSEEQKRAEALQKQREEAEREKSAQNAISGEMDASGTVSPETAQNAAESTAEQKNAIIGGSFKVQGTKEQIRALVQFMKQTGIHYELIKN